MNLGVRERRLMVALAVLLAIFLAFQIVAALSQAVLLVADVLVVFIVAWALSYLLAPLVERIDRRSPLDRTGAVIVVYLGIFVVLAAILALAVPSIAGQLATIAERGPEYGERARAAVIELQRALDRAGVQVDLAQLYGALPTRIGDVLGAVATDALGFVTAIGTIVFNATLALIIAFIMLIDGDRLWQRFTAVLSDELRSEADLFRQSADRSFGGFVRGSLLLGLFYGAATLLYLVPLGVPFAGVLAIVAGLAVIIPFFGPVIAMVPILAVTLLGATDRLPWVFLITIVLQQVTLNVVGPRILSNAVGIHPLFVFFALLLGSRIAGVWGVLLAMPVAGILNTFVLYVYEVSQGRRARTEAATLIEDTA
ncbi:MAG: AI-2E family transporter, partial [Candidatus Limnocylindria bacterium]